MNRIDFIPVKDKTQIKTVEELAGRIWRQHYTPMIGAAQVDYMLEKFQSIEAIEKQIIEGYQYYLFKDNGGKHVGYLAVVPRSKEIFLSKFYVDIGHRGRGYGWQAMDFVVEKAKSLKALKITLTVNRDNAGSIAAYKKLGFKQTDKVDTDIGEGFSMCDYAMEKVL